MPCINRDARISLDSKRRMHLVVLPTLPVPLRSALARIRMARLQYALNEAFVCQYPAPVQPLVSRALFSAAARVNTSDPQAVLACPK